MLQVLIECQWASVFHFLFVCQSELIFDNLGCLLQEAGLEPRDVVHFRAYVTDRSHFPQYMAARDAFLGADHSEDNAVKPVRV